VIPTQFFQETYRRQAAIRNRWIVVGLFITSVALVIPRLAQAQASAGMTGTVTDSSGAVVPNADVTVTNQATSVSLKTITSSAGTYTLKASIPENTT